MKNWGRLLLAIGFVWLVISSVLGSSTNVAVTSKIYDSLSKQETFTKIEVQRIIADFYKLQHDSFSWPFLVLAPAFLMLIGGFILDRVAEGKAKQLRQGNSS